MLFEFLIFKIKNKFLINKDTNLILNINYKKIKLRDSKNLLY